MPAAWVREVTHRPAARRYFSPDDTCALVAVPHPRTLANEIAGYGPKPIQRVLPFSQ